jgi:hypothetical protein
MDQNLLLDGVHSPNNMLSHNCTTALLHQLLQSNDTLMRWFMSLTDSQFPIH